MAENSRKKAFDSAQRAIENFEKIIPEIRAYMEELRKKLAVQGIAVTQPLSDVGKTDVSVPTITKGTATVYYIRHGYSCGNYARNSSSMPGAQKFVEDPALHCKGIKQAILLAEDIANSNIKISGIYTSQLLRSIQTGLLIAKELMDPQIPFRVVPHINEEGFGYDNNPTQILKIPPEADLERLVDKNLSEKSNFKKFEKEILPEILKTGQTILVVSHGNLLKKRFGIKLNNTQYIKVEYDIETKEKGNFQDTLSVKNPKVIEDKPFQSPYAGYEYDTKNEECNKWCSSKDNFFKKENLPNLPEILYNLGERVIVSGLPDKNKNFEEQEKRAKERLRPLLKKLLEVDKTTYKFNSKGDQKNKDLDKITKDIFDIFKEPIYKNFFPRVLGTSFSQDKYLRTLGYLTEEEIQRINEIWNVPSRNPFLAQGNPFRSQNKTVTTTTPDKVSLIKKSPLSSTPGPSAIETKVEEKNIPTLRQEVFEQMKELLRISETKYIMTSLKERDLQKIREKIRSLLIQLEIEGQSIQDQNYLYDLFVGKFLSSIKTRTTGNGFDKQAANSAKKAKNIYNKKNTRKNNKPSGTQVPSSSNKKQLPIKIGPSYNFLNKGLGEAFAYNQFPKQSIEAPKAPRLNAQTGSLNQLPNLNISATPKGVPEFSVKRGQKMPKITSKPINIQYESNPAYVKTQENLQFEQNEQARVQREMKELEESTRREIEEEPYKNLVNKIKENLSPEDQKKFFESFFRVLKQFEATNLLRIFEPLLNEYSIQINTLSNGTVMDKTMITELLKNFLKLSKNKQTPLANEIRTVTQKLGIILQPITKASSRAVTTPGTTTVRRGGKRSTKRKTRKHKH